MPICKKCGERFPSKIRNENNKEVFLNKRSYCLACSPFGKPFRIGPFPQPEKSIFGKDRVCRTCGRTFKHKTTNLECTSCQSQRMRHLRKSEFVAKLGGKCYICGYDRTPYALNFHHLDGSEKEFNISSNWLSKKDRIEKEVIKCILLCSNCHDEYHAGIFSLLSDREIDLAKQMRYIMPLA